jgi:dTDP-4-dehydrorhamnose reductase
VFDGKGHRPYREDDPTAPQGVYGLTKLLGEQAFAKSGASGIIIRTSWVYSSFGHNFVKTMLRLRDRDELRVVFDQVGTPTYARDLAGAILHIIENRIDELCKMQARIYHYSNEGAISWYDFAQAIFEIAGSGPRLYAIRSEEYPIPAKRPHYSVLDKSRIKEELGVAVPYWRESLRSVLEILTKEDA